MSLKPHGNAGFIALNGVSYAYPTHVGNPVLQAMDLSVHRGEYLLISGKSGSGKSSLVRTFNGLIPHFYGGLLYGSVSINGSRSTDVSVTEQFHRVGMVFQNPQAQLFSSTVEREIVFGLESLGLSRPEMHQRLEDTTRKMALQDLLQRNPQKLSGGEQQWVAIAAILALQPDIMVLDEPMANLDPIHVQRLRNLLMDLRGSGLGIVVCEHRLISTLPDADRIIIIDKGRKLLEGDVDTAVLDPAWPDRHIELPLALQMGRRLGLTPLPRQLSDVIARTGNAANQVSLTAPYAETDYSRPHGRPLVALENVGYRIDGNPIVDGISFTLHEGQCSALVGANGAGKTTLIKLINGLIKPGKGKISIAGEDSSNKTAWQLAGQVATAFQNPNSQFFKLTVEEEIMVAPKTLGRLDNAWIDELIDIFQLGHLLKRAPFKLSGGEKKRVAFAAALAAKPQILVLDEPTAGQDYDFRQALINCLHRLTERGATVLVVTHALNFLEPLTNRWLVMAAGRLLADGPADEIMADQDLMMQAGLIPTERFQWNVIQHSAH